MLFRRRAREKPALPSVPEGRAVYAVGDVHGRADLLDELMTHIDADAAGLGGLSPALVFLGDYVDRGPDSRGVIDRVLAVIGSGRYEVHALKGNHEHALSRFLEDPAVGPAWVSYGGLATVGSYLGSAVSLPTDEAGWEAMRVQLADAVPERHRAFLDSLELYYVAGDYCFVHAGLKPGVPLEAQEEMDLIAIRREFLSARKPFEKFVVYGHTPNLEPAIEDHRIGIDTGAFATGILTCLKLVGTERTLLQTGAGAQAARERKTAGH
jgi:serine/threonine protein phosphatase 1